MHFEKESEVQKTLVGIGRRLEQLGIPYAVAGGMALFFHGYRRFTEDVDLLVTRDGLRLIHEKLEGLGYLPPVTGSKNLRDTGTGVRIEFLVTGDYPGDGQPKPVAFPDPATATEDIAGLPVLTLPALVEFGRPAAATIRPLILARRTVGSGVADGGNHVERTGHASELVRAAARAHAS